MPIDYFLAESQAQAGAGVLFSPVKAFERSENPFIGSPFDADTVVMNADNPCMRFLVI